MIEPLFPGRAIVAFARRRSGGGRAPEVFQGVDVLADDSWLFMSGTASADGIATAPSCPDSESRGSPFAVSRKPGRAIKNMTFPHPPCVFRAAGVEWLICSYSRIRRACRDSASSRRRPPAALALAIRAVYGRRRRRRWTAAPLLPKATLLAQRRRDFCPAQSISYANTDPLLIIEGRGAQLIDEAGRVFLDTRNNVAHVGHGHPAVAAAVARQAAALNTNTRYLHPNVCALARKLLATMPAPLSDGVVFFVNSGSEANDLALRLARATNKRAAERVLVVDHAYHGHTVSVIGLSPYKFEHKSFGGKGQPAWVTKCPAPDTYRGPHRGADAARDYAAYVERACADADAEGGVCAFFIESGMSVAGVILPPEGYLRACYAAVRAAGGVCVADEVQTGLGRFGTAGGASSNRALSPTSSHSASRRATGCRSRRSCARAPSPRPSRAAPSTSTRLAATPSARRPASPSSMSSRPKACVTRPPRPATSSAVRC